MITSPYAEILKPTTDAHVKLLAHLISRIKTSEDHMLSMHARWQANEQQMQAFVMLNDFEEALKKMNEQGKPPSPISITVPFTFATVQTIVTYLFHTFGGRKPIFALGAHSATQADKILGGEQLLQYNCDRTRFIRHLYQFLLDDAIYGFAAMRMLWKTRTRRVWQTEALDPAAQEIATSLVGVPLEPKRSQATQVVFEGSDVATIDPWCFFPDPQVPLADLSEKGEFVAWRAFVGKHELLRQELDGKVFHIAHIGEAAPDSASTNSARTRRTGGNSTAAYTTSQVDQKRHKIDQIAIWISPKKYGLSDSAETALWLFSIANDKQIIAAEPLDLFHGRLPVECCESNTLGYSTNNMSIVDYLTPMNDTMSWLINSHIYNVRASMNNQWVVNPNLVEMKDLENPEPGKLIRLKNIPFNTNFDVRSAISQLQVGDVTAGNLGELQQFARMGADLSGASDNLRGIQETGGRKTATEVRVSGEAGASRLAAKAKLISAQAMIGIAEQMLCNYQQFMTKEYEFKVLGNVGEQSIMVNSESLNATDFYFPIHDGTLPLDKLGMVDLWREIFNGVLSDPTGQLRQSYDITKIFEFIAKLGGAENIENFRVQVKTAMPDELQMAAQSGNAIPLDQFTGGF
jgi:hypothetical protein